MVNHGAQTAFAADVAKSISGQCDEAPLIMGGEDFAYMLEARPGAYIFLGNGDTAMCHHPKYVFEDEAMPFGMSFFAEIVEARPIAVPDSLPIAERRDDADGAEVSLGESHGSHSELPAARGGHRHLQLHDRGMGP